MRTGRGRSYLLEFKAPPIRVACVVIGYKDEIIEPDDNGLFSIGSEIKVDVLPTTL